MIYFAQESDGPIKIGYAASWRGRESAWQTLTPGKVRLLGLQSGDRETEKALHEKFSAFHARGEWFYPCPELIAYIRSLPRVTDTEFVDPFRGYAPSLVKQLKAMGENIKLARLRRKITKSMLAERAGLTRPTLDSVERGDPRVGFGRYASVLHSLSLDHDIGRMALDDEFGRKLQDVELLSGA